MTMSWLSVVIASAQRETPDPDRVTPGLAGFLVMFFLALATLVLIRSMIKHLRKVRYSPDPAAEPEDAERAEQAERTNGGPRPPAG